MVVTVVITELSYRFIEMPTRRRQLGKWLDRARDASSDPRQRQALAVGAVACVAAFGFAAVSMLLALPKQNEVQASDRCRADDITDVGVLLDSTTTAAAAPTSTGAPRPTAAPAGVDPTTSTSTAAATTTTATGRHLAIGDPVMAARRVR